MNDKKVIEEFKKYVEAVYLDVINESTINIYSELFSLTKEEKQVLLRRFC